MGWIFPPLPQMHVGGARLSVRRAAASSAAIGNITAVGRATRAAAAATVITASSSAAAGDMAATARGAASAETSGTERAVTAGISIMTSETTGAPVAAVTAGRLAEGLGPDSARGENPDRQVSHLAAHLRHPASHRQHGSENRPTAPWPCRYHHHHGHLCKLAA